MVLAPLVLFVLILVMVGFAAVVALALLPIFGAAGEGVNAFRERLDAAGVGRAGIPHLPQSSTIFAADGKTVLAEIFLDENRRYARIGKFAPIAQQAVVAIEDDSFYEHGALNFPSLMRAAITNLIAGDIEQGGSTLTQQLVKNVLIDSPQQTFARKFQEAALAIRVERKYSKDHILELYMNEAYYGNGAYGIETAAETYFATTARDLSLRQAALLAGVIRAPGAYDPVAHPELLRTPWFGNAVRLLFSSTELVGTHTPAARDKTHVRATQRGRLEGATTGMPERRTLDTSDQSSWISSSPPVTPTDPCRF